MKPVIGIDLGATNVKGIAVSPQGRLLAKSVAPANSEKPRLWRAAVLEVLHQLERKTCATADRIGLAAPGLAARDELSIACLPERLPGIEGFQWKKHLGVSRAVPVLNDGHAALLGETWRGAAKGCANVALFTLGTGVGGAAIIEGRLLRGHLGRAGHFGHLSLDPAGEPDVARCPGSLELAIGDCSVATRSLGRFSTNRDLLAAARGGDAEAKRIWLDSVRALAAGITSVVNIVSPERVVIGGGIAKAGVHLFRPLKKYLDVFEWRPMNAKVSVVPARLGDLAGAYGAAWKALNFDT